MGTAVSTDDISAMRAPQATASIWRLVARKQQVIVALNAAARGPSIYCIHSIGGDLHGYDRLAEALGATCRIFGLQVPGPTMVPGIATDIEAMAERYAQALVRFQPAGPFVIAGYSAGAVIGLAVARQLCAMGREVPLLVAFDGAPHMPKSACRVSLARSACGVLERLIWRLDGLRPSDFGFRKLRSRAAFREITKQDGQRERAVERDNVSRVAERSGWSAGQQRFMAELYAAMRSYTARPYDGRVLLYEARAQPIFKPHAFGQIWTGLAQDCEIVRVRTRHSGFFESPTALRHIAVRLHGELRRVVEPTLAG